MKVLTKGIKSKSIVESYIYVGIGLVFGILISVVGYAMFPKSFSVINYGSVNNSVQAVITNAVMAKGVDALAKPVEVTSQFVSSSDKSLYMVLTLQNAKTSDKITYVRYFNGNYINSSQASPSKNGVKHFYFNWNKTASLNYPTGNYLIKIYINGILDNAVSYTVI